MSKEEVIAKTNAAREARQLARDREAAAVQLQKITRGWLTRLKIGNDVKEKLDSMLTSPKNVNCIELYKSLRVYLLFCREESTYVETEFERLEKIARFLVLSLDNDNPKKSYVGVALNKEHALAWISHMKTLLGKSMNIYFSTILIILFFSKYFFLNLGVFCSNITKTQLDSTPGQNQLSAWLGALVAFTATATWKVFQKPSFVGLKPGMEKLCQTFLAHLLNSASLMQTMKFVLLKGTSGSVNLKKNAITAIGIIP